jgi:hypothetical protein
MPRRGRCRCGLLLIFRRSDQGYKTRCPNCGSVVRLRTDKGRRRRSRARHAAMVAPPPVEDPAHDVDVELVEPSVRPYARPSRVRQHGQIIVLVVVLAMVLLAIAGGVALWLLS